VTAILGLFNLLPGWLYAAAIAALMATNCATLHRLDNAKVELSDLKAQHAEAARAAEASARAKEQAAAATLAAIEKKAHDEQKALAAQLAIAHRELRSRADRPSDGDMSKNPSTTVGCTGAQLYRSDAAFLIGESARADRLRIALAACQAAYDNAVKITGE
jgi:hypothetical protein